MKESSYSTDLLILERYPQLLFAQLNTQLPFGQISRYYLVRIPTLLLSYQTSRKTMADKTESPETEHLESDTKLKPSTLILPSGSERQPYGKPGINPPLSL